MTNLFEEFNGILQRDEPLSRHTWLRVGGPAEYFFTPQDRDQLLAVVARCIEQEIPFRVIGSGSNILASDSGTPGAVIKVCDPVLSAVTIDGTTVVAEGGALLSRVVTESVRAGLAGPEALVGIPGTVAGAVIGNSGGRNGDIGKLVSSISVVASDGSIRERSGDELSFAYRSSSITDHVVLSVTLSLKQDDSDDLTTRMRRSWIMKRSTQPLADQSAGCIFRNPRGLSAGALIEQCGLKGLAVGQARISDRHANFIVTESGATSSDVEQLIQRVQAAVSEKFGVDLELEIRVC